MPVLACLSAAAAFAACVRTSFDDGQYSCVPGAANACPDGLICARDGRCRSSELPPDGGLPDAPADAGADTGDPCPSARWRTVIDGRTAESLAVRPDGRLFVAGAAGAGGWLAEIDRCDGGVVRERTVPASALRERVFRAIAPLGDELVVTGGEKLADGGGAATFHGRFALDLTTVAETDAGALPAGEGTRITIAPDGTPWISGPSAGASATGFVARLGPGGCDATFPTTPGGIVARSTNDGIDVLRDGNPAVLAYVDPSCTIFPDARTVSVGTGSVDVNGLVAARGGIVAVGTAQGAGTNTSFWLAETKLANASWNIATLDPNPAERDVGRRVAFDGDSAFAAVSQRASAGSGTPTLYRYDGPIAPASKPAWSATPFGPLLIEVRDVVVEGASGSGVYTAASSASAGGVARCSKGGDCAP